jgi:hypothetical protein
MNTIPLGTILLTGLLAAAPARAKKPNSLLPLYSYAIESGDYSNADAFTQSVHVRIPDTIWNCTIAYAARQGLVAECAAPSVEGPAVVIERVSCQNSDNDAETIHLSTLDTGRYASVYIGCRRDQVDDGF